MPTSALRGRWSAQLTGRKTRGCDWATAATQSPDVGGVRFGGSTDALGLMRDRRALSIPVRLVLASTLMLFLELSLIRWSGAQVVHLSYFSNFILLGSFLGIGLGFLRANRSKRTQPFYRPGWAQGPDRIRWRH
jgi:hypothetical protein